MEGWSRVPSPSCPFWLTPNTRRWSSPDARALKLITHSHVRGTREQRSSRRRRHQVGHRVDRVPTGPQHLSVLSRRMMHVCARSPVLSVMPVAPRLASYRPSGSLGDERLDRRSRGFPAPELRHPDCRPNTSW